MNVLLMQMRVMTARVCVMLLAGMHRVVCQGWTGLTDVALTMFSKKGRIGRCVLRRLYMRAPAPTATATATSSSGSHKGKSKRTEQATSTSTSGYTLQPRRPAKPTPAAYQPNLNVTDDGIIGE